MKRKRLRKIADIIEYTGRFDLTTTGAIKMGDGLQEYLTGDTDYYEITPEMIWHNCETVACVAGWVNAANDHLLDDMSWAADWLGLNPVQANRLFLAEDGSIWSEVASKYGWDVNRWGHVSCWSDITAEQAAEVLRDIADRKLTL